MLHQQDAARDPTDVHTVYLYNIIIAITTNLKVIGCIAMFENHYMTTSCRFKCVPQNLGSLSIHLFKLLFFLITHS